MAKKTSKAAKKSEIKEPRQFNPQEVAELQELTRIANNYSFVASQIKGNTALIPGGQMIVEQFEAISRLLQNTKSHWVSQKLAELGWPQTVRVQIDVKTGVIIPEAALNKAMQEAQA